MVVHDDLKQTAGDLQSAADDGVGEGVGTETIGNVESRSVAVDELDARELEEDKQRPRNPGPAEHVAAEEVNSSTLIAPTSFIE